ncbi:HTH_38 domain-containing protein [Trichonephila clavipes]|nr:HTH_38 domain-containing protein [Trichonephila clavipes]
MCTQKKSSYNHETRQECSLASEKQVGRIDVSAAHLGRSDMVVARCWQQWITEGRVYRRGGSGRPRNTNDREDRNQKSGHFGTNNVASIDSTPLTSFQTSSAIKRNHKETTDRSWLEEPTSAKTLTTDPTS